MENRRSPLPIGMLLLLLFFVVTPVDAKTPPFKDFDHPRLVETAELAGMIDHPSVRIIDMRTSLLEYLKSHIPKAVYLPCETLQVPDNGIPAQAPDRICMERLLGENLGVSNNMWVILYSERSNSNATLLAWTLTFLDHKRVGVVNGGWEKWSLEGLPTTQGYPSLPPKKFFGKVIRESLAEKKWVWDRLFSKNVVLVDGRQPAQYSGEESEEVRRGHIPGARNIFWETTLQGDEVRVWKKKEELEKVFRESGITRDKEVIVYCQTGREASHLYFSLKFVLGFPHVSLYRGSWVEWSADPRMPVKVGMDP